MALQGLICVSNNNTVTPIPSHQYRHPSIVKFVERSEYEKYGDRGRMRREGGGGRERSKEIE
jgi:hypothetical protein